MTVKSVLRSIPLGIVLVAGAPAVASVVNLGMAGNYAVLGIGGASVSVESDFEVYQSATVINGNVGMGPFSQWTHGVDATINGRIDYDTTDSAPTVTGTVTGGVHQINMMPTTNGARNADTTAAAFAPTQTFATLVSGQTIVGGPGLNVIRITGDIGLSGGGTTLMFSGDASSQFLLQIVAADAPSAHTLTLSGVTMSLLGGVTADNILWDMHGTGGGIVISSGATVYGTFLAPDRGIEVDHGNVYGAVIGGGGADSHSNSVSVHSSSNITIPAPGAGAMLVVVGGLLARRRR